LRVIPPGAQTIPNQEIYPFTAWNPLIQDLMPGAQSILSIGSLSVGIGGRWAQTPSGEWAILGGSWKPMWRRLPWSDFQARFRIYGRTFMGTISEPGWFAQYGLGPAASLYLAPVPTQNLPMEVDLILVPSPLLTDNDPDPIPYPWTDAVSYWAAVLCLIQQQRPQEAQAMMQLFNSDLPMCASVVAPRMLVNPYGATMRSA
jgi:hypothetical protein